MKLLIDWYACVMNLFEFSWNPQLVTQTGDRVRIVGSGGEGGLSNGFRKPKFSSIVNEYMGLCFEEHCSIGKSLRGQTASQRCFISGSTVLQWQNKYVLLSLLCPAWDGSKSFVHGDRLSKDKADLSSNSPFMHNNASYFDMGESKQERTSNVPSLENLLI